MLAGCGFVFQQSALDLDLTAAIVFSDAYAARGMPNFTGKLSDDDVVKLTAFIQGVADSVRPKEPAAAGSK